MSATELTISLLPFGEIDCEAVAALVNAAFHRYPIMTGDRTSAAELAEEAGGTGEFIQVWRGERLVGTAMVRPATEIYAAGELPLALGALQQSLYFGLAAVDPMEMNSGIGKRLVAEAERIAAERGYAQVVLETMREFGLVEYYARQSYVVVTFNDFEAGHWAITVPHRTCKMVKAL
jgi:GNAT superfamily N-acetyltransferase